MPRLPKSVLLAPAALLVCLHAGCGTTPRDEFLYNRQAVVHGQPGDGSRIASRWNESRATTSARVPSSVAAAAGD
jgi:hypothetical protein